LDTIFMQRVINESDWRIFRNLHAIALERFCQRVLSDINQAFSPFGCISDARATPTREVYLPRGGRDQLRGRAGCVSRRGLFGRSITASSAQ
jgi:hypothetical protein